MREKRKKDTSFKDPPYWDNSKHIKVVIAPGLHLFPSRTEKLSPVTPMVLRKWESRQPPLKTSLDNTSCRGFVILGELRVARVRENRRDEIAIRLQRLKGLKGLQRWKRPKRAKRPKTPKMATRPKVLKGAKALQDHKHPKGRQGYKW